MERCTPWRNQMTQRIRDVFPRLLRATLAVVLVAAPLVGAQEQPAQTAAARSFKPEELEQIAAPIARSGLPSFLNFPSGTRRAARTTKVQFQTHSRASTIPLTEGIPGVCPVTVVRPSPWGRRSLHRDTTYGQGAATSAYITSTPTPTLSHSSSRPRPAMSDSHLTRAGE